jgi:hypothetical protein
MRYDSGPLYMCERCWTLFEDGDDHALVALQVDEYDRGWDERVVWTEPQLEKEFKAPLRARRRAATETHRLTEHVDLPEIAQVKAAGFEALEHFTGSTDELGPLWPTEHSRSFAETRWFAEPGELCWYIRSPWPTVPIADIFLFLWDHVEHDRTLDPVIRGTRVREALNWSEDRARAAAEANR